MGKILDQTMAELKQLPLMLGKLAGGIITVAGFTVAMIETGNPGWSFHDIWVYLFIGFAGGLIFSLSARSIKKRWPQPPKDSTIAMSALSWGLLLLLAGLFLGCIYFFNT
jgi:H+/Cl- antiporter ClcA